MYRHLLLLSVFLFSTSAASAWGLLRNCFTYPSETTKLACFIDAFVKAGQTPVVNLTVDSQKQWKDVTPAAIEQDAQKLVEASFKDWVAVVRNTVASSGRTDEFHDFLTVWPQSVAVNLQKGKQQNQGGLRMKLSLGGDSAYTCAVAYPGAGEIEWYSYRPPQFKKNDAHSSMGLCIKDNPQVILHEIGHLLGLGDLYFHHLEIEASTNEIAGEFSLLAAGIPSTEMIKNSIMVAAGQTGAKNAIACDDVDGIVNIYDIFNYINNGTESPRWQYGWDSFCPNYIGKFRYAYGLPFKNEEERKANKERLEALKFFRTGYAAWNKEYASLSPEISKLEDELNKAPRPLSTTDLMKSARLEYLKDRQNKVGNVYSNLERLDKNKSLLAQYREKQKWLENYKSIAPGTPMYDQSVLSNYKPSDAHLMDAVAKKQHYCIICKQLIAADEEAVTYSGKDKLYLHARHTQEGPLRAKGSEIKAYAAKYGYNNEQEKVPALTYAQLMVKAGKEGLKPDQFNASMPVASRVNPGGITAAGDAKQAAMRGMAAGNKGSSPASKSTDAPTISNTARVKLNSSEAGATNKPQDNFSESALAKAPRAKVADLPKTDVTPKKPELAKVVDLKCSVCGKKIENEADAYIAPEARRGAVHKHSECAYKYFARFYSTDNASLDKYDSFSLFGQPAGVTAAKGLMKKLGLTPAEVKAYAQKSRAAVQEQTQKRQEELNRSKKWAELKASYENACSGVTVNVTQADIEKFTYANRAALNKIRTKQQAGKKLTQKERLLWQRYQQMLENEAKQKKCSVARTAWQNFNKQK